MAADGLRLEPKKLFRYPDPKLDTAIFLPRGFQETEEDILRFKGSPIYWVVGARGSGKSQLLHHVARQYLTKLSERKILPVFVEMQGSYGEGVYEANRFRENLSQYLLRALFSLHRDIVVDYSIDSREVRKSTGETVVVDTLQKYLREYLAIGEDLIDQWAQGQPEGWASRKAEALFTEMIREKVVNAFILIIDDFDKYRYETISDCLLKQQAFYSHLIDLGCKMFFTANAEWFRYIGDRRNTEWNFYQGVASTNYFEVPLIASIDDARTLIESRLRAISDGDGAPIPFLPGAYLALVEESRGVHRTLIDYAQVVLDSIFGIESKIGREKTIKICRLQEKPPERRYQDMVAGRPPSPYTKLTIHQVLWRLSRDEKLASLFRIFYRKPEITYDVQLVSKYLGRPLTEVEYQRDLQTLTDWGVLRQRRISDDVSVIIHDLLDDLMIDLDDLFRLVSHLPEVLLEHVPATLSRPAPAVNAPVSRAESWSALQTWTFVAWSDEDVQPYLQATMTQLGLEFDYDVLQRYLGREYSVGAYLMRVGQLARLGLVNERGPVAECRDAVLSLRDGLLTPRLDSRDVAEGLVRLKGAATPAEASKHFLLLAANRIVANLGVDALKRLLDSLVDEKRLIRAEWGDEFYLAPNPFMDPRELQQLATAEIAREVSAWQFVVNYRLEAKSLLQLTQERVKSWLTTQLSELCLLSGIESKFKSFSEADSHSESMLSSDALKRWEFTKQLLTPDPIIKDPRALMSSCTETLSAMGADIAEKRSKGRHLAKLERDLVHQGIPEGELGEIKGIADLIEEDERGGDLVEAVLAAQAFQPIYLPSEKTDLVNHLVKNHVLRGAVWTHKCGHSVWVSDEAGASNVRHPGCELTSSMTRGKQSYWIQNRNSLETWRKAIALSVLRRLELPADRKTRSLAQRGRQLFDFIILDYEGALGFEILREPEARTTFLPVVSYTRFIVDPAGLREDAGKASCSPDLPSLLRTVRGVLASKPPHEKTPETHANG